MELDTLFLILATGFGFFMACGLGANDVSNAMGTSVGSGAVSLRQAIVIATIFEFSGALLAGGEVADTLRGGLIDTQLFLDTPYILVVGMLSALMATAFWLALASYKGWPVSTTHTIVGAILGFGLIHLGPQAVQWHALSSIFLGWGFSPILGGLLGFGLFKSVQRFIFNTDHPLKASRRLIPVYLFISAWIFTTVGSHIAVEHLPFELSAIGIQMLACISAAVITSIGFWAITREGIDETADRAHQFQCIEKQFGVVMLMTACAMAFAHGSNDVANAVGPLAAIAGIIQANSIVIDTAIPFWVLLLGALGIVVGLLTYGHRVIGTIGNGITQLTPTRGFAATLSAATTVVLASHSGLPISTTHTLVGAILGVGLARGVDALNLTVIKKIFLSWFVTLPAGALLAVVFYECLIPLI